MAKFTYLITNAIKVMIMMIISMYTSISYECANYLRLKVTRDQCMNLLLSPISENCQIHLNIVTVQLPPRNTIIVRIFGAAFMGSISLPTLNQNFKVYDNTEALASNTFSKKCSAKKTASIIVIVETLAIRVHIIFHKPKAPDHKELQR